MPIRIINIDNASGPEFTTVSRRRSDGTLEHTQFLKEQFHLADHICQQAMTDSVQVTCDGKFKIGDRVRPTRTYIRECCQGSIPMELIDDWSKGFKITEIGPDGFPWKGAHAIELEGCDMLMLDSTNIEKVGP